MAPIALWVLALLVATVSSQTTQALPISPWWCMRTTANESTGEVWAEMAFCRWNTEFHIDAPNVSDGTIRTDQDLCLNGGSEGAFFDTCAEGEPLQKWKFVPAGVTAETLATPDGADSVSGQIVVASENANTNRPKMCLKGTWTGAEGTRVTTVPCDSVESYHTTWTYAPLPPANKVLLVMPARHAAGETACVQMRNGGYLQLGDCGDEDLVLNWWVREGDLIRSAAGGIMCLAADASSVYRHDCDPDDDDQRWSLGADGALKVTTQPEARCFTYVGEGYDSQFYLLECTGDDKQKFTFLSDAPTTDSVQVA